MLLTDFFIECAHVGHDTAPWVSLMQVGASQGVLNMIYNFDLTSEGVLNQDNSWCQLAGYYDYTAT